MFYNSGSHGIHIVYVIWYLILLVYVFKGVNVCVYVGEGLRRSFATPNPFELTNKICLNQEQFQITCCQFGESTDKQRILKCV